MSKLEAAAILDVMIDGVTITDMHGKITDFNQAASEQLGYEKGGGNRENPSRTIYSGE